MIYLKLFWFIKSPRKTILFSYATVVLYLRLIYMVLPKISENFNIPRKPLVLRTGATRCLRLYLWTVSQPIGVFISAHVSEFWLFSLHFSCVSAIIKMADVKEQRICITFCFKLNKTAAETHWMLKEAFGEQALNQARTFEWFKRFKDGRESVEDRKHSGWPSTCTTWEMIAKVREVIREDRLSTMLGSFTARFWDDWGKIWGTNGLRCGRMETGCCTITMRLHTPRSLWGNSWHKITWPLFPTLPTHLTWPPVISVWSLKWNSGWKGSISYPLKRSKQNRSRY